jgi:HPt (histidine-containing phosphotransfer) domain-containing protein
MNRLSLLNAAAEVPADLPDPEVHERLRAETVDQLFRLGGERLMGQLLDLFAGSTPERIEAIRQAQSGGDREMAERAAHTLKSSAGNLGAMRMWAICQCLESLAMADAVGDRFAMHVGELEREYAIVEPRLRKLLEDRR